MISYRYIPIDYYSYNRPDYLAATLVSILLIIFFIILNIVFVYEYANRIDKCLPMFYYGKACQNENSRDILNDPKLMKIKKMFYDSVARYDESKHTYEGVRKSNEENKKKIEESEQIINNNLEENSTFVNDSIEEIKKLTAITNLIASKYLANMEEILSTVQNSPKYVVDSLVGLPEHLVELKNQIQETLVNPLLSQYTGPLKKLYKSLTQIQNRTKPYLSKN